MAVNIDYGALQPRNFLADAAAGYDQGRKRAQDRGLADANAQAATDPLAASGDLMRYGDLQGGNALRDRAYGQRAASALASGDRPGAMAAAGHLGPEQVAAISDHFAKVDDKTRADALDRLQHTAIILQGVGSLPQAERLAAARHYAQQYFGPTFDPNTITEADVTDQGRAAGLRAASTFAEAIKQAEGFTLGQGQSRFDSNGRPIASVAPKQEYQAVPEGGKLVPVPQGGPAQATPGGSPDAGAPPAPTNVTPLVTAASIQAIVGVPVDVTSGARTPEHNAEVGGVPNSRHLTDQARDFVPRGISTAEAASRLRAKGYHAIDEGTHVHVDWGGQAHAAAPASGDPPGTIYGAPKPGYHPSTPAELAAVNLPVGTPAQTSPEGKVEPMPGTSLNLKPVPATIHNAVADRRAAVGKIDRAIAAIRSRPQSLGLHNVLGDTINQRIDAAGVDTRSAIADVGSALIHDRSGAAVTAAETPRLLPFIPSVNDDAQAAITKLNRLRMNLMGEADALSEEFGPDTGYRPLDPPSRTTQPAAARGAAAPHAAASGVEYRDGYPVLTSQQSQAAAKDPKNRGKGFWGADGVFRRF